jgi:hypothetical protein
LIENSSFDYEPDDSGQACSIPLSFDRFAEFSKTVIFFQSAASRQPGPGLCRSGWQQIKTKAAEAAL